MSDTMPTGIDIEAMARAALDDAGGDDLVVSMYRHELRRFASMLADRFASIAERMGLDAESDEAKRLAVEIGAAIRAEVG